MITERAERQSSDSGGEERENNVFFLQDLLI